MKDIFFAILGAALIVWSFYAFLNKPAPEWYQSRSESNTPIIKAGDYEILVEVRDTPEGREEGLSGRDALEAGHGMLFVFQTPDKHGFWMKDMKFPIDIVWIGEDWKVVGIERLINPDTYPNIFYPEKNVKYVLELPSGDASRLGIDTGDSLYLDARN